MIRFFEKRDKAAIISLWQEAFGDAEKEISDFLDNFSDNLLLFESDGYVPSMLTALKIRIGADNGRYIYALATDKRFRGQGFATELIEYMKRYLKENDEKFLLLLPQSDALFDFYEKRGFSKLFCAEKVKISDFSDISDKNVKKITAEEYFRLRKEYFLKARYAEWDIAMLRYMQKLYDGEFVVIEHENRIFAAAFCHKKHDKLMISELLINSDEKGVIAAIADFFRAKEAICQRPAKSDKPFAMVYPPEYQDTYFGLGMNF